MITLLFQQRGAVEIAAKKLGKVNQKGVTLPSEQEKRINLCGRISVRLFFALRPYLTSALGKPYASTTIFIRSGDLW